MQARMYLDDDPTNPSPHANDYIREAGDDSSMIDGMQLDSNSKASIPMYERKLKGSELLALA